MVLVRDGVDGLEVLLVRRNPRIEFYGGAWVFPGGRVDAADLDGLADGADMDSEEVARVAAVREVQEEAALVIDPSTLVPWSHWTTPEVHPKRYATWFFLAPVSADADLPDEGVVVDGDEIHAFDWVDTDTARQRFADREIELAPPTWLTLTQVGEHPDVDSLLRVARSAPLLTYEPRIGRTADGDVVSLYRHDAGWPDTAPDTPGPRHRLHIRPGAFEYHRVGVPGHDDLVVGTT